MGIRVSEPGVLDRLESVFPPGSKPAKSRVVGRLYSLRVGGTNPKSRIRRYHLLYADLQRIGRSMDLDEILERLASDVQLYVAESSPTRVITHAGVVGVAWACHRFPRKDIQWQDDVGCRVGEGLARPTIRMSTPSFDSRGRVHPYPRPLSASEMERNRPLCTKHPVEELGGSTRDSQTAYQSGSSW